MAERRRPPSSKRTPRPRTRPAPRSGPRPARGPKPRQGVPEPLTDAERGVRLQKAMADLGVASRRDCENLIEEGRVSVNGEPVTALPAWVDPARDAIEVDGHRVNRPSKTKGRTAAGPTRHTYLMVHKPRNVVSTNEDPEGRRRVVDLVDTKLPGNPRLYPVGRLDMDSTGLILLTDDGELANRLTHPRYEVTKQYQVSVKGRVEDEDLERLRKGLFLADRRGARRAGHEPAKKATMERVQIIRRDADREHGDRTLLHITLREGQNREIRRLLARVGFKVRRLKRIAIGPLKLKGVSVGGWRPLTPVEVGMLKRATGMP